MTAGCDDLPPVRYYTAAEVAEMLRCSTWWVQEQARRRRIPFAWIAGGHRFTCEHIRTIAELHEVPAVAPPTVLPAMAGPHRSRRRPGEPDNVVPLLAARSPRRLREAQQRSTA